jgi:N-glycosylase/DNA lyase
LNLDSCPFDLDVTLCCGQVFRWDKRGDWWYGVVGDHPLKVRQSGGLLEFAGVDETFIKRYFSLDHDLQKIGREVGKDAHVKAALSEFWGLRIVRQPPWECLVSFICATYKSVAAIRQMLLKLSEKFGEKVVFESCDFHAFPTDERLAKASLQDLEGCGLGYRAKYVLETSKLVCAGDFDLDKLLGMGYVQAKETLLELPGVGAKVADCVLLFSSGKLEAFPVDVWVKRIVLKYYSNHFEEAFVKKLQRQKSFSDTDYKRLNGFGREYFGAYAGYAQEYLYHYERLANRKIEKGLRGIEQEAKHR